jgi:hypothetical protein
VAAAIEGYPSQASVVAGDFIDFHVRCGSAATKHFDMHIVRRGAQDEVVATASGEAFNPGPQDDAALAAKGCGWPAAQGARTTIPAEWRSGYYVARISSGKASDEIPFVVRSSKPGTTAQILMKMSDTTVQAYNKWGGASFYSTPFTPNISYDRPDSLGGASHYEKYQRALIAWAETHGFNLDYCSGLDLHTNPRVLEPYRLMLSVGHDEYWSHDMRAQTEAFIAAGGNVCFFSANTCYWQMRFDLSNGRRIMTCYKETENHPKDPERDPSRITVRFYEPPINRPENILTGVSFKNGAGWFNDNNYTAARFRGYTVTDAEHWVYAGSGLTNGATFGAGTTDTNTLLGYETDAALYVPGSSPPEVSGADGTPKNFHVLATAELKDWQPHGAGGHATMGLFRRNGTVFTGGTINWASGLGGDNKAAVPTITGNLLRELSRERPSEIDVQNASFESWTNGVPDGWHLEGKGSVSQQPLDAAVANDQMRFGDPGHTSLRIDGTAGETWISHGGLSIAGDATVGAGCWMKASAPGCTIRLQTTDHFHDFATAAHSGNGQWEYVFATGSPGGDGDIPVRVKIQIAAGAHAIADDVSVVDASDPGG